MCLCVVDLALPHQNLSLHMIHRENFCIPKYCIFMYLFLKKSNEKCYKEFILRSLEKGCDFSSHNSDLFLTFVSLYLIVQIFF